MDYPFHLSHPKISRLIRKRLRAIQWAHGAPILIVVLGAALVYTAG